VVCPHSSKSSNLSLLCLSRPAVAVSVHGLPPVHIYLYSSLCAYVTVCHASAYQSALSNRLLSVSAELSTASLLL
jgi:hypothetical protein